MKKSMMILVTGILVLAMTWAEPPKSANGESSDPMTYWIEADGNGTITYFDRNDDDIADYMIIYDAEGTRLYEEQDFNYDGIMDDFYFYEDGVLSRREVDSNFDGSIDLWVEMFDGVYVTGYERDADHDGKIDIVKNF